MNKIVALLVIVGVLAVAGWEIADNLVSYTITAQVGNVRLAPGDGSSTTYVVYLQDGRTLELMRSWIHSGPNEDKLSEQLLENLNHTFTFYCYGIQFDWGSYYMYPKVYDVQLAK